MSTSGVQGTVAFPEYVSSTHMMFLFGSVNTSPGEPTYPNEPYPTVFDALISALDVGTYADGNPFNGQSYINPNLEPTISTGVYEVDSPVHQMRTAVLAQNTKVATLSNEKTLMDSWVADAVARIDTAGVLNAVADQASAAIVSTGNVVTDAQDNIVSPFVSTTDWASHWVAAKAKADVDLTDLVYSTIVVNAMDQADSIIINGIGAAMAGVDEGEVTAAIAAFTAANAGQRAEGIRQLSGSFADVSAVQTSTFMISLGLAKIAESNMTAQFQSQLRLGLYQAALTGYFQTAQSQSQVSASVAGANKAAYERVLSEGTSVMANLEAVDQAYRSAVVGAYVTAFSSELQHLMENEYIKKKSRDNFLAALVQIQQAQKSSYINAAQTMVTTQTEVERIIHALTWEYEGSSIDLEHLDAFWIWEVYQAAGNILSGPAGMAAAIPPSKSKLGSAVGGALGGAVAAAPYGPHAAAAGAVLGGIAGLL